MGFRFRKQLGVGPLRVTLSRSGVGMSVGVPGYRKTLLASGRVRTTVSLPGTGLSYVTESGARKRARGRSAPIPDPSTPVYEPVLGPGGRRVVWGLPRAAQLFALFVAWGGTGALRLAAGGTVPLALASDWFTWATAVYVACALVVATRRR